MGVVVVAHDKTVIRDESLREDATGVVERGRDGATRWVTRWESIQVMGGRLGRGLGVGAGVGGGKGDGSKYRANRGGGRGKCDAARVNVSQGSVWRVSVGDGVGERGYTRG